MEEIKKEFFVTFTDATGEEGEYYDSEFEGVRPQNVWYWIEEKLNDEYSIAYEKGYQDGKNE